MIQGNWGHDTLESAATHVVRHNTAHTVLLIKTHTHTHTHELTCKMMNTCKVGTQMLTNRDQMRFGIMLESFVCLFILREYHNM